MKITIFCEMIKTIPRPHPYFDILVSNTLYKIKKCKIGRKIIPNVTRVNINYIGNVDVTFGNKPMRPHSRKEQTKTELELEINGENVIYDVLSINMMYTSDKTFTIKCEIKKRE